MVGDLHVRVRDRIATWLFVIFWLVPVAYVSVTRRAPPLPATFAELTNVTCLFTRAQPVWVVHYVQVRTSSAGPWVELDTHPFFGLEPFGYRTRLDRYLVAWSAKRHASARDELAQWLMMESERRDPDAPEITELRFVAAYIAVRRDRPPEAAWSRPPLERLPANHRAILSTHERRVVPD